MKTTWYGSPPPDVTEDPLVMKYLNCLSDYLFTLARKIGHDAGAEEVTWRPR